IDVVDAGTIGVAVPCAEYGACLRVLDDVVSDRHVVRGWHPRLRERFKTYPSVVNEIALDDTRIATVVVNGCRRLTVPNRPVPLDADIFQLVAADRVVVCATVSIDTDTIRIVDPVAFHQHAAGSTSIKGQRLAHGRFDG